MLDFLPAYTWKGFQVGGSFKSPYQRGDKCWYIPGQNHGGEKKEDGVTALLI